MPRRRSERKTDEGGLRRVRLFRFGKDDKIIDYWDVTRQVEPDLPNAANAF